MKRPGKPRAFVFEGREFPSLEQWRAAYPAYRNQTHHVIAGARSIMDIERMRVRSLAQAKLSQIRNARHNAACHMPRVWAAERRTGRSA
ncbi:MAG TPA: hypothetical protein VLK29_04710 [Luteimonas sp.]|nr:hypothetical protein [Luteimonas sp.]